MTWDTLDTWNKKTTETRLRSLLNKRQVIEAGSSRYSRSDSLQWPVVAVSARHRIWCCETPGTNEHLRINTFKYCHFRITASVTQWLLCLCIRDTMTSMSVHPWHNDFYVCASVTQWLFCLCIRDTMTSMSVHPWHNDFYVCAYVTQLLLCLCIHDTMTSVCAFQGFLGIIHIMGHCRNC